MRTKKEITLTFIDPTQKISGTHKFMNTTKVSEVNEYVRKHFGQGHKVRLFIKSESEEPNERFIYLNNDKTLIQNGVVKDSKIGWVAKLGKNKTSSLSSSYSGSFSLNNQQSQNNSPNSPNPPKQLFSLTESVSSLTKSSLSPSPKFSSQSPIDYKSDTSIRVLGRGKKNTKKKSNTKKRKTRKNSKKRKTRKN